MNRRACLSVILLTLAVTATAADRVTCDCEPSFRIRSHALDWLPWSVPDDPATEEDRLAYLADAGAELWQYARSTQDDWQWHIGRFAELERLVWHAGWKAIAVTATGDTLEAVTALTTSGSWRFPSTIKVIDLSRGLNAPRRAVETKFPAGTAVMLYLAFPRGRPEPHVIVSVDLRKEGSR